MGVYVKKMKMPESCLYCPLCQGEYGPSYYEKASCIITHEPMNKTTNKKRLKSCPLIEVKEPHGRVIDVSPLMKTLLDQEGCTMDAKVLMNATVGLIMCQPIVIEAER